MAKRDQHGNPVSPPGVRLYDELNALSDRYAAMVEDGFVIRSLRVRPPRTDIEEWLVTVAVTYDGDQLVGFTTGVDLAVALHSTVSRLLNGSMKWQGDKYADK